MNSDTNLASEHSPARSNFATGMRQAAQFAPTHWSVVLTAAGSDSPEAAEALARLCQDYGTRSTRSYGGKDSHPMKPRI